MKKFSPQPVRTPLGQSQSGCPVFKQHCDPLAGARGAVWGVIFSSPFWLLAILIVLWRMN